MVSTVYGFERADRSENPDQKKIRRKPQEKTAFVFVLAMNGGRVDRIYNTCTYLRVKELCVRVYVYIIICIR